ncbi:MAG: putative RND superfamily exporter protein [Paraglaciecola sp.]|jgi:predicted RND superfamily exporter protein
MRVIEKEHQFGARFGRFVIEWHWSIFILFLLCGLVAAIGVKFISFDPSYRAFFSKENPELIAFENIQRTYTKSDTLLFAILPSHGDTVFQRPVLEAISLLTEKSWLLPYSRRVDSITNFQHIVVNGDDLLVANLVDDAVNLSPDQIAMVRLVALEEPSLVHQFVSESGDTAGVLISFQLPGQSLDEISIVALAARKLAENIEANYPVEVKITGILPLSNAFSQSSARDASTLIPLMYLLIIILTLLLLRSVTATIGMLFVLLLSVLAGVGIGGWFGILLTSVSSVTPTIISTLAIADSVHFLMTMMVGLRCGMNKNTAIIESMRINLQPIFLTSLTTAVGFLSLNFSDSPPFQDLGNMTAIGVMAAFVFSVTILPAFLAIMPVKAVTNNNRLQIQFDRLADFVIRKRKPILVLSLSVSLALVALIPLNNINDDMVAYFDPSMEFRQHTDITLDRLTGIYQLQFSLDSGNASGASDPDFLRKVDDFSEWLRLQPEVQHVNTITDTFKRLNKNLHGDDDNWYTLPVDRAQAAQYLLLYELSLPFGLDLNTQLNIDKSSTLVVVTVRNMNSDELVEMAERSEKWLRTHTGLNTLGSGMAMMFAHISERNIDSMINGTIIAILIIAVIIMTALRSVSIGVISLVPNLLPVGITFGIWAVLVGEVNVAASIVMSMVMGILVDDSVHFLSKYQRARREYGLNSEQAVRYAFHHVGAAILVTSITLIAGFLILAQSTFALNQYMAQLTALAVFIALFTNVLLLPTLLITFDKKTYKARNNNPGSCSPGL